MFKSVLTATAAIGMAGLSMPAAAANQDGLVNVSVEDVNILRDSLNKNDVDVLNHLLANSAVSVPVVVQVPIGIAANVCGVSAVVLGKSGSGAACTATSPSRALGKAINDQVIEGATATQ